MQSLCLSVLLLLACSKVHEIAADCYMHNPPGSNDRNRESNGNRNNANRLFDSQNNAAGGYPWRGDPTKQGEPDPITYYEDSELHFQFTVQHALGAQGNAQTEMVLQYACEDTLPGLRDGYPMGGLTALGDDLTEREFLSTGQNDDGTNTIPLPDDITNAGDPTPEELRAFYIDGAKLGDDYGIEFGMHESYEYYNTFCLKAERNKGLYIADRNLGGDSARFTRQNNNGNRHGFECAE